MPIANAARTWEYIPMTEDPFIAGLRKVFEADPQLRPATISAKAGLDKSTIRRMFEGAIQSPRRTTTAKIANALGMSVEEIENGAPRTADAPTIAIAGKVGAGARVPVFDVYEKGDGPQVECPPGLSPHNIVAVEIEGDSMEPVYSAGDLLFYTRWSAEGVPSEAIGKRCVCECEDGFGWVKLIRQGREPGLFDLHSFNDQTPPMYGVKLKWAAPIKLHWPAELARRV
ncbi:phage repressor protein C with HTH and peptisase S24 domain [Rhodovulum sulfidophilum]|uniref:S24 family peptidase n=2 Tax=Rhodovulum sulfidophilum TaxID=35806 RepID=UPI0012DA41F4|nr:S24 family peptidase [Rhodovulum sulfidophilum]MCW2303258.1 phage repressor protein C with HTH and peptisase S24 domain [Rhodovulum sulfidophilum]